MALLVTVVVDPDPPKDVAMMNDEATVMDVLREDGWSRKDCVFDCEVESPGWGRVPATLDTKVRDGDRIYARILHYLGVSYHRALKLS